MADTEAFVVWKDRYLVGIHVVDEQHKELLRLTNALYNACLEGSATAKESFRRTVKELVDYTKFHFSAEEKIMERVRYPGFADHKKEHEAFVKKVLEEVQAFENGRQFIPNIFARFLRDWILTHIAMSDKKYAAYILELKKDAGMV